MMAARGTYNLPQIVTVFNKPALRQRQSVAFDRPVCF
jgi:hypothetical protein